MNSSSFTEFFPQVLTLLKKIKKSDKVKSNPEQLGKIIKAEEIISTILDGFLVRNGLQCYSKCISPDHQNIDDPKMIDINGHPFTFDHIRLGIISGLMSATWGIYDNITQASKLLLDVDQNGKVPNNLLGILECEPSLIPIPGNIIGPIRQKYRCPLALSYQIRNSVFHRLPYICGSQRSFISDLVEDGFIIRGDNFREILRICQDRHGIKIQEIEEFGVLTGSDQCLLEVLEKLEPPTDECSLEIFRVCLKPHIPNNY